MNNIWKILLGIVGVMLIIFAPIIGIIVFLFLIGLLLKVTFNIIKYVAYAAICFFIICFIVGLFVS